MTPTKQVVRWRSGHKSRRVLDELAVEEPLEIRVDTRPVSVTMRTPGNDDELAAGFLVTEGLVRRRKDIAGIQPYPGNKARNVINVFLSPHVSVDFERLTRHVFASSSCGLCGKATIDAVHQRFKPIGRKLRVSPEVLLGLPGQMRGRQQTFERTGGLHAAAVFDLRGRLVVLREDVGRHNAVDKVIGFGFLHDQLPFDAHVLMVSGRASFEIMQKALAARIPIVCAVSAPSSLAVEFARESGQTLAGFLRGESMNVYSRPERISAEAPFGRR
ncbi:MAG TPA: formate dehydrogenase accessory sulfurtransferase FdhD [Verrucomicrobiae bacterium]|nr:formate dehydrogenase accessory sulfurtransferase FdhD [Verrucomicrobiae bacterium]